MASTAAPCQQRTSNWCRSALLVAPATVPGCAAEHSRCTMPHADRRRSTKPEVCRARLLRLLVDVTLQALDGLDEMARGHAAPSPLRAELGSPTSIDHLQSPEAPHTTALHRTIVSVTQQTLASPAPRLLPGPDMLTAPHP